MFKQNLDTPPVKVRNDIHAQLTNVLLCKSAHISSSSYISCTLNTPNIRDHILKTIWSFFWRRTIWNLISNKERKKLKKWKATLKLDAMLQVCSLISNKERKKTEEIKSNSQIRRNATSLFTPCYYKRERNIDKKSMPKQWRLKLNAMQQLCPLLFSLLLLSSLPFAFLWPSLTFLEFLQGLAEALLGVTSRQMLMMTSNLELLILIWPTSLFRDS